MTGRIAVIAVGTRGDTVPYVALGAGLKRMGFDVTVACDARYRHLVARHGLGHAELQSSDALAAFGGDLTRRPDRRCGLISELAGARRLMDEIQRRQLPQVQAACTGADAIVCSLMGIAGQSVAERQGIPCFLTQLQPIWPTGAFPSSITWSSGGYRARPERRLRNRLSHLLTEQGLWQMMRSAHSQWRQHALGLPHAPALGPFARARRRGEPVLLAFSPAVQPPPADWPGHAHVTGYWFLDLPAGWSAPAELTAFLAAGPPPVYVGFASWHEVTRTSGLVREALRRANVRGVIAGDPSREESDENIFVVDDVPHAWLFPRMAAVAHHGGAGTTAAALRAGVPSVICASIGDQAYWGARVHALGAGPAPIQIKALTPGLLAEALTQAAHDSATRDRAAALGYRIRSERGVASACEVIAAHLQGKRPKRPGVMGGEIADRRLFT